MVAGDLRKLTELRESFTCDNPLPKWEPTWQPVDTITEDDCVTTPPPPLAATNPQTWTKSSFPDERMCT